MAKRQERKTGLQGTNAFFQNIPLSQSGSSTQSSEQETSSKQTDPTTEKALSKKEEIAQEETTEKIKATFYLEATLTEDLEDAWIQLRRMVSKDQKRSVSKSAIVEAALRLALDDLNANKQASQLAGILVNQ